MPEARSPLVSVVTVNFNAAELTGGLIESLRNQTYRDHEVVVVDNASTDDSVEILQRRYPEVRLIRNRENSGFVGGNNAGIGAAVGDLIALANNDTVAESRWLEELVDVMESESDVGAVASKILFLKPFLPIHLELDEETGGRAEDSPLLVGESSCFTGCNYRKPVFRQGFGASESRAGGVVRPLVTPGLLYLPLATAEGAATLELHYVADGPCRLRVKIGGHHLATVGVQRGCGVLRLQVPARLVETQAMDLINNAGTRLSAGGEAADRGIYEPDRGQYDQPQDLESICGAAVLLRRSALAETGLFDRDFFMYYEDTDLSWRLRHHGFRLRYQPRSVIRHVHAASSVEWSPRFTFFTARNRVLMVAKNGGAAALVHAYGRECRTILGLVWRVGRQLVGRGESRALREVTTRLRVQGSLVWQIPRALLKRAGLISH